MKSMTPRSHNQQPELITRKEAAAILSVSVQSFASNERRLGLEAARVDLNKRLIRYDREAVLAVIERNRRRTKVK